MVSTIVRTSLGMSGHRQGAVGMLGSVGHAWHAPCSIQRVKHESNGRLLPSR